MQRVVKPFNDVFLCTMPTAGIITAHCRQDAEERLRGGRAGRQAGRECYILASIGVHGLTRVSQVSRL